jgi:Protein of unknown function (DUF2851)
MMSNERVLERLLHCIWSEQLFRKTLQIEGKTLAISSPGWWNLESGPDFRSAELFLDGERLCGDVEIHLNSDDWYHHKHDQDTRYNNIVLHVVLYDTQRPCIRQDQTRVPQLVMKDHLLEELRLLRDKIPIHEFPFGPDVQKRLCRTFMDEQDPSSIERLLDSAGDQRMRRKKEHFLTLMNDSNFTQAFYEGMMEGMGYKQSRYAFRELARRVPIAELLQYNQPNRRGIDAMASILLGTAGLLGDLAQIRLETKDPETNLYLDELFDFWRKAGSPFKDRALVGFTWYPSSTRPANFPARRLTAVAAFFHYFSGNPLAILLEPLKRGAEGELSFVKVFAGWLKLFSRPLHLYWSYHFQFERRKFTAPVRLIGKERGKILTVNVVLPALLGYAEVHSETALERLLHSLYCNHPRLAQNSVTRLMEHRLFGEAARARAFICSARRQQALHHFFYDFCDNTNVSCSRCEFSEDTRRTPQEQDRK